MSFDALKKMKEQYEAKIQAEGKSILAAAFKELFESAPEVKAVKWTQYTPYFNDGEPCKFRVREFQYKTDVDDEGGDYGDGFYNAYEFRRDSEYSPKPIRALAGIRPSLEKFERQFRGMDDVMLAVFGDHAEITATPDGKFVVDSYSHD